jgi:hypothetical protein
MERRPEGKTTLQASELIRKIRKKLFQMCKAQLFTSEKVCP